MRITHEYMALHNYKAYGLKRWMRDRGNRTYSALFFIQQSQFFKSFKLVAAIIIAALKTILLVTWVDGCRLNSIDLLFYWVYFSVGEFYKLCI